MRRIRIIGLCLAAALTMSALATASASAAPEYYTEVTGKLKPLGETQKVALTTAGSGTSHFEMGFKMECASDTGKGDLEGPRKVVKLKMTFKGCHESGNSTPCENKTTLLEQITTELIKGELTEASETSGGPLAVALRLEPEKKLIANFVCGTTGHTFAVNFAGAVFVAVSPSYAKAEFTEGELLEKLATDDKMIAAQKGVIAGCGGQSLLYEVGSSKCLHLFDEEGGVESEPFWFTQEETVKYGTKKIGVFN